MADDSWPELSRFLVDLEFDRIVEAESHRTLYVLPEDVGRAVWIVEQAGADRRVTVAAHPWVPPGTWLLVDGRAVAAGLSESQQALSRRALFPSRPWCPPPPDTSR